MSEETGHGPRLLPFGLGRAFSGFLVVLILGAGALLAAKGYDTGEGTGEKESEQLLLDRAHSADRLLPALTVEPEPLDNYEVRRSFAGRVEARRESKVGFELAGLLSSVRVDEGDRISAGEILATLDRSLLEAARDEARAVLQREESALELAHSTVRRVREARSLDALSPQDLDEAVQQLAARAAAADQARAALLGLETRLAKTRLLAPFDAVVAGRLADEGRVLATGSPVLHLLEDAPPLLRVGVPEEAAVQLVPGSVHGVLLRGVEEQATVISVLPLREERTRSVEVLLALDLGLGEVLQGDLGRLQLTSSQPGPGFWLPLSALREGSRGLWAVMVARPEIPGNEEKLHGDGQAAEQAPPDPSNRERHLVDQPMGGRPDLHTDQSAVLERRQVAVLHQETDRAFVRGTLAVGEKVVVEGLHRLVAGQRVRLEELPALRRAALQWPAALTPGDRP